MKTTADTDHVYPPIPIEWRFAPPRQLVGADDAGRVGGGAKAFDQDRGHHPRPAGGRGQTNGGSRGETRSTRRADHGLGKWGDERRRIENGEGRGTMADVPRAPGRSDRHAIMGDGHKGACAAQVRRLAMPINRTINGATRDHRRLRTSLIITTLWLAMLAGWHLVV